MHVHDASAGQVTLQRALRLLLDRRPGFLRYGRELAVQVVHLALPPRKLPMSSEPGLAAGPGRAGWAILTVLVSGTVDAGLSSPSSIGCDGTKNRFPVTARLKSRSRS